MSELNKISLGEQSLRRQLLISASALALLATACVVEPSYASEDADRPTVWIDLGAQIEKVGGFGSPLDVPFDSQLVSDGFQSLSKLQRALTQSLGGEGKLSFQPKESDWIFSAGIRYGRANGRKFFHEQTPGGPRHISFVTSSGTAHTGTYNPAHGTARFSEPRIDNKEAHTILDFQAGKDLGLGLFGGGQSTFGFGVRVGQFTSSQDMTLKADPDFEVPLDDFHNPKYQHNYAVASHLDRSFRGIGPSFSWNASAPALGNSNDDGITLDWGVNAALLFGRQKVIGHHQTIGTFYKHNLFQKYHFTSHIQRSGNPDRSKSVVVPNLGGFAGLSFNFSNAKVALGYRADFFFGAMDGGIDVRKSKTLGFYGPFASIGIGLGG